MYVCICIHTYVHMRSYETLVLVYETTRRHIPKHCDLLQPPPPQQRNLPPNFTIGFGRDTFRISVGTRDRFYVVFLSFPQGSTGIVQGRYLNCQLASIPHSISRDVRQISARRCSSWPWVGVHAFYFNALLLVLGFHSPYLNMLLELFFICSQERVRSKRHAVCCTGVKWLVTVVG
jgi:hypothetical protein